MLQEDCSRGIFRSGKKDVIQSMSTLAVDAAAASPGSITCISMAEPVAQKKIPNDVLPRQKVWSVNARFELVLPAVITPTRYQAAGGFLQRLLSSLGDFESVCQAARNYTRSKRILTKTHPSDLPRLHHTRLT